MEYTQILRIVSDRMKHLVGRQLKKNPRPGRRTPGRRMRFMDRNVSGRDLSHPAQDPLRQAEIIAEAVILMVQHQQDDIGDQSSQHH